MRPIPLLYLIVVRTLIIGGVFSAMCAAAPLRSPAPARIGDPNQIDLSGEWSVQLDPENRGETAGWIDHDYPDRILLPGTLDVRGKSPLNPENKVDSLTRVRTYLGPAWFQRQITIPPAWAGKRLLFSIERSKSTRVWFDGKFVGKHETLTTEQVFELSDAAAPGTFRLTVCVNNADRPPVGDPHQLSDATQTNWNGLLGQIRLRARDSVWIENIQVFPRVADHAAHVRLQLGGPTRDLRETRLELTATAWNSIAEHRVGPLLFEVDAQNNAVAEATLPLGPHALLWDEFTPNLYRLRIELTGNVGAQPIRDSAEVDFGLREFARKGTQFAINGKTVFLRGKHDGAVFPLTGYAPMTVEEWGRILQIARDYGINHYRFHTWCPPEAAFAAADMVGIYFQPELPNWTAIGGKAATADGDVELRNDGSPGARHTQFLLEEGKRILSAYGNHPSFVMFALGNELDGKRPVMEALLREFRQHDPRPLYAEGSNNFFRSPTLAPSDDYWTTTMTGGHYNAGVYYPDTEGRFVRGSYPVHTVGHVNNRPPSTDFDYAAAIRDIPVPVIGHEIGQYQVYPDFREIPHYTGVLQPRNFEMFRSRLKRAGMLDQAEDFVRASGALAVICYREDIETALRTPGFGGFQLLDLQDYPGQGLPTIGVLNALMESKGLIKPELWREFCGPIVPLLRLPRRTWTQSETLTATAQIAHYGPEPILAARLKWALEDAHGVTLCGGTLGPRDLPQGVLTSLGQLEIPLASFPAPSRLTLRLWLDDTEVRNSYPIWNFPDSVSTTPPPGLVVARAFTETVRETLAAGGRVLLLAGSDTLDHSVPGAFQTDFWSYPMFKKYFPPGTLGILCDPKHPALARFPTEYHSDWQWWRILRYGRAMILDGTPTAFRPIVQVIDNAERNHKLALLFEARVGTGRLLACSGALLSQPDAPEARQLLHSLLTYAASDAFDPRQELDQASLEQVLAPP